MTSDAPDEPDRPDERARRARRRQELEGYAAQSRRVRRVTLGLGAAGALAGGVALATGAPTMIGLVVLLVGGAVAGAGAWITWGHLQDFDRELRDLARRERRGPARPAPGRDHG